MGAPFPPGLLPVWGLLDGHGRLFQQPKSVSEGGNMPLKVVSWSTEAWRLAAQAVAPSGEDLELFMAGDIPGLSSSLGLCAQSQQSSS